MTAYDIFRSMPRCVVPFCGHCFHDLPGWSRKVWIADLTLEPFHVWSVHWACCHCDVEYHWPKGEGEKAVVG